MLCMKSAGRETRSMADHYVGHKGNELVTVRKQKR